MADTECDIEPGTLTRDAIETGTVSFYREAGGTRPDLRQVCINGRVVVVKDFKRSDPLFRLIVGPILIRREFGALRKLQGVQGIPQLIARVDRYALAIQHIQGKSIEQLSPGVLQADFYRSLRNVIDAMHARGVAHCDLRSRGNIVLGDDGLPYLVDFAAAVFRGRGINPFTQWLFRQFARADRYAVLMLKRRLSPELLTDTEKAELDASLPFERPAKAIGETVRRITRTLLTHRNKHDTTT